MQTAHNDIKLFLNMRIWYELNEIKKNLKRKESPKANIFIFENVSG